MNCYDHIIWNHADLAICVDVCLSSSITYHEISTLLKSKSYLSLNTLIQFPTISILFSEIGCLQFLPSQFSFLRLEIPYFSIGKAGYSSITDMSMNTFVPYGMTAWHTFCISFTKNSKLSVNKKKVLYGVCTWEKFKDFLL